MISATQAKAEGYTIDNHAAGRPIAYKGKRFAPTETVPVLTDLEEQLLAALEDIVQHIHMDTGMQRRGQAAVDAAYGREPRETL